MIELNKVHNIDCLEGLSQLNPDSVDIVITDIPYGINYEEWDVLHKNTNSALGKNHKSMEGTSFKRRGKPINGWNEADKKISYEYQKWCEGWAKELYRVTKQASPVLIFSSRRYLHRVSVALEDAGFLIRDVLVWNKVKAQGRAQRINNVLHKRGIYDDTYDNYRIGNLKPQYEPIIWAMKPYDKTLTDCVIENKIGGFYCENDVLPSNIIEFPANKKNKYHPTEKPLGLMEKLVSMFSISDEHVILDPFAGSGTTLLAAKNLGKKYIGFELNEEFAKIANMRLNESK